MIPKIASLLSIGFHIISVFVTLMSLFSLWNDVFPNYSTQSFLSQPISVPMGILLFLTLYLGSTLAFSFKSVQAYFSPDHFNESDLERLAEYESLDNKIMGIFNGGGDHSVNDLARQLKMTQQNEKQKIIAVIGVLSAGGEIQPGLSQGTYRKNNSPNLISW
jgi:hypothetical protein